MIRTIILLALLLLGNNCYAQADSVFVTTKKTSSSLKIAYNSSIVYPGIRLGIETLLKRTLINKIKKSGSKKVIFNDIFLNTTLSWYHHPTFHDNLYLTTGIVLRRTYNRGFFIDFSPEIGYSRTFVGGTTYQVDSNGDVSTKKMLGYNHALFSIGGGLGYDFSKTKLIPLSLYYKFNIIMMLPYNSTIYLRPAMELGFVYRPKKFLPFKSKIKNTIKNKKY